jgi:hypothetical protein
MVLALEHCSGPFPPRSSAIMLMSNKIMSTLMLCRVVVFCSMKIRCDGTDNLAQGLDVFSEGTQSSRRVRSNDVKFIVHSVL